MKIYGADQNEITQALISGEITIAVFGLGRMGLPLATVFADCGARVIGADIDPAIVSSINHGDCYVTNEPDLAELIEKNVTAGRLSATSDLLDAAKQADVMIIVVPTILDSEHNPDLSNIKSLYKEISKGIEKGDVVIQESTVPPRTTIDVILPILEESGLKRGQFGVARCPEHAKYGSVIENIRGSHRKVVGGVDDASTQAVAAIYSVINSTGVITVRDSTTAEAVKLFAAAYKDVNIALANELAVISDELGVNAIEVFEVLNRPPAYAHIFTPGCGVGGHCIPVCGHEIVSAVKVDTPILSLAREINDGMANYTVSLVQRGLQTRGVALKDANVLVMGITYRGDQKDTLNSPSILIIQTLNKTCGNVYAYDPLLRDEVGQYNAKVVNDLAQVGKDVQIDVIVIASDHSEFKTLDWNDLGSKLRHKVIVDGRQCLDIIDVLKMRDEGWTIFGIGTQP